MRTDVLIVGSGIMGAAVARLLREGDPALRLTMIDGGRAIGDAPGVHLHDVADPALWARYNERVASGIQGMYTGAATVPEDARDISELSSGMHHAYVDDGGRPLAHSVGVSLYAPVASRAENRLAFSTTETDLSGMPRISIEFDYCDADRALIERGLQEVRSIAEEFGSFDPVTERALLPPGSSLHLTGTVRAGLADDGSCVCDPAGRVWGFENLYLAGNGVIPGAMAANVTLTGAVTAVRAVRAVRAVQGDLRGNRS
ncbi:GMC oxidoreductase [Actinospica sp.]|jgi:choline dehydrogenase-like flavoprotein|uniref:GMC oxidoreductase n=1 Tax=Actinospica sp. TaxID=1872142 RepID=UPI002BCE6C74|nr:GMC oxidoreductase [Actinospica sp.]HWG26306.1 GMC oxidoreductase [Actinospica sp.]